MDRREMLSLMLLSPFGGFNAKDKDPEWKSFKTFCDKCGRKTTDFERTIFTQTIHDIIDHEDAVIDYPIFLYLVMWKCLFAKKGHILVVKDDTEFKELAKIFLTYEDNLNFLALGYEKEGVKYIQYYKNDAQGTTLSRIAFLKQP